MKEDVVAQGIFDGALVRQHLLAGCEVEHDLPEAPPPPATIDWEAVQRSLTQVDETFRAPIALFYIEDYSYKEIAEILDVPLGTVKSRIARGIRSMQKMLADKISTEEKRG